MNNWNKRQNTKTGPISPKVKRGKSTKRPFSRCNAVLCLSCLSKQLNRVQRDAKNRKTQTSNSGFDAFVIETHLHHRSLRHSSQICIVRLADTIAVSKFGHSRRAAARGNLTVLRRWSGVIALQSWHLNIVLIEFEVVIWDQCRSFVGCMKVAIEAGESVPCPRLRSLEPTDISGIYKN